MASSPGLRERKTAKARQALYEAALALFRQQGFEQTTVEQITARAGFSRATFFNHFGTKEGVLRHYGQQLQQRMEELVAGNDPRTSPLERIRRLLLAMAQEAEANREDLRVIYAHSIRDPAYLAGPTPARRKVWDLVAGLVAEAQRRGEARGDLPARELARHLLSLHQSTVLALVTGGGSAQAQARSAWRFLLGGLRGEEAPR